MQGYFEQWLRAAQFPGWEEDVSFIRSCRIVYAQQHALLTRAIRWRFQPDQPFPFGSKSISDPRELAMLIDRDRRSRQQGLKPEQRGEQAGISAATHGTRSAQATAGGEVFNH